MDENEKTEEFNPTKAIAVIVGATVVIGAVSGFATIVGASAGEAVAEKVKNLRAARAAKKAAKTEE